MAEQRLEVVARLRDEMSSVIATINGNMGRMATVAEANFARIDRTLTAVKAAMAAIASSKAISAALGEAAALDRAQMQLEAVLGDSEKATAALERLKAIPVTKFFGTDELVQAFIRLQTIGVPAAEKTVADLRNIAVIFNSDLSTAVDAFVTRKAGMLSKLGIDVQKVGDQMVLTSGDIRVVTDETAASMRAGILEVWEKRFPDAAERATSLFEQKMAVLRSSIMDVAGDVGQAFLPQLKELADKAIQFVNQHRDQVSAVAQSTGEIFTVMSEFIVQTLDRTIMSTEFWSKLPAEAGSAMADVVKIFGESLVLMASNWDLWVPTLMQTLRTAFLATAGGLVTGVEKLLVHAYSGLDNLMSWGGTEQGQQFAQSLMDGVDQQVKTLSSYINSELTVLVDNVDASIGLLQARMERARLDRGGQPGQSLLEDGMSMVGGAADAAGLGAVSDQIAAIVEKNRVAAEEMRKHLAEVKTDGGTTFDPLEAGADKATGKTKKLGEEAQTVAEKIRAEFQAISDAMGPAVDKADAQVALMRARIEAATAGGAPGALQDANAEAMREAQRAQLAAEMALKESQLGVLNGQPGQETAAAAMATDVETLRTQIAALNAESARMESPWSAFNAGLQDGLAKLDMTKEKWRAFADDSIVHVASTIRSGLVDNLQAALKHAQSWGDAMKNAAGIAADALQRVALEMVTLMAQQAAMAAARETAGWISRVVGIVVGAAGSAAGGSGSPATLPDLQSQPALATGGIVYGGLSALPRAANGAIFRGTQMAIVGDNPSRVEAAVPMPNGREIPVQLKGGTGGDSYHFSIQTLDARGVRDMLMSEEGTIVSILRNAVATRPNVRRDIRGS